MSSLPSPAPRWVGDGRPRPAPASVVTIAERVERRLEALMEAETARWSVLSADLAAPLDALRRLLMDGGKRLRPAFCYWGHVAAGGAPDEPAVVDAGAAFELLHAFALVHDDVMDGSSTRRGQPTVHLRFGDLHVDDGWRGEPRRFGEGVAILVGDLAHVYADSLMRDAGRAAGRVWDELRIELNVGQYLDMLGTARRDTDSAGARLISRYKSGKYTVERPLHVGALIAGRDELVPVLSRYGDPLGEAFQLRDDVLGAFGDAEVTGKPVGDDLREGKPTPLLALATEKADARQTEVLGAIGRADLSADEVAAIQQVLVDTGALDAAEAIIDGLAEQAVAALDGAPIAAGAVDALTELADFVAHRTR